MEPSSQPPLTPYPSVEVLPDPIRRWLGKEAAKEISKTKWYPQTQAQFDALDNDADILLLGGAAGSLKTSTILCDLAQEYQWPKMRSYFFRRTYTELEGGDGAIDQSYSLFSQIGGTYNSANHTWKFASGAELYFRHAQHEKDVHKYQGHAITALGIDESTHWPMEMIRYLISRNRSTDQDLTIRTRLGTNPGNVGHMAHMKVFFNGVCPHCEPDKAPPQNKLRHDAKWHDGQPMEVELDNGQKVSLSTSYILSNVRDHDLLGNPYIARLKMQSPATAKALLDGCWKIFEGQYFDCWDYKRMTMALPAVAAEWWWPHWTSTDYGYAGSAAASHLWTRSPAGVIYILQEYPSGDIEGARREDAKTFARNFYNSLIKHTPGIYEQPKRLEANYIGRDSDAERGAEHTLMQMMQEELAREEVTFSKVPDDRSGSSQLFYIKLASGQLVVCRNCVNTIAAIESRLHDEDKPMEVKKDHGSYLDDYMDSAFHGLYGYLDTERKPADLRAAERAKKMIEEGQATGNQKMAFTTAVLQYEKIKREAEAEDDPDEPVYVGGNARQRMHQRQQKNSRQH